MTKSTRQYLGFDLGASGGRAIVGTLRGRKMELCEVHRFPNGPVALPGNGRRTTLYWDIPALWANMQQGLAACAAAGVRPACVGVDAWGADFGLLDVAGTMLGNAVCYRDARTAGSEKLLAKRIDFDRAFAIAGQAPHRIHNLAQLFVMTRDATGRAMLDRAQCFLPVPDLLRYFLCGHRATELTIAGSCQMLDLARGKWSLEIVRAAGIPRRILPPIVRPGTIVGELRSELMEQFHKVSVAAVAGHDTASAVAALPAIDDDCAFLSLGTWGICGMVSGKAVAARGAREAGFINQMGLDGVFFNRNLAGLHLFETLRRDLTQQGTELSYPQILREARAAKPFAGLIHPNGPLMTYTVSGVAGAIEKFLRASGQLLTSPKRQRGVKRSSCLGKASHGVRRSDPALALGVRIGGRREEISRGAMFRMLLESLALSYRACVEELSALTGRKFRRLCAVGGGTKNEMLCQFIADATGLEVLAGPTEATAMGNLAIQALACGDLDSTDQVREVVRNSSAIQTYHPQHPELWHRQYDRFRQVVERTREL